LNYSVAEHINASAAVDESVKNGSSGMETSMGTVTVTCPITGTPISTGIETEADVLKGLPPVEAAVHCPHCGEKHFWTRDHARLAEATTVQAT